MKEEPEIVRQLRKEEEQLSHCKSSRNLVSQEKKEKTTDEFLEENHLLNEPNDEVKIDDNLLQRAQRVGKLGIWKWNVANNTLYWSDELYRIWQWDKNTPLTQEDILARIHPDDRSNNDKMVKSFFEGQNYDSFDFRIILPDDSIKYIHQTIEVKRNLQGSPVELFGIMQDITIQRKAQIQHEENEQRFRFLSENMADIIWTMDLKGKTTYVSPSVIHVLGFTPEERMKQSFEDMLAPASLKLAKNLLKKELLREKVIPRRNTSTITVDIEYYTKEGSTVWLENKMKWIRNESGKIIGIHGVSRDISERKRVEKQLKESEKRYKILLEASSDGIYILDREWRHLLVNKAATKFVNLSKEKLINNKLTDLFPGIEQTLFFKTFQKVMTTRESANVVDEFVFDDGRKAFYEVNVNPVPEGILCISRDITKRKEIEGELLESEQKYRLLTGQGKDVIFSVDLKTGKYTYISPSCEEIFGLKQDEFYKNGNIILKLIPKDTIPFIKEKRKKVVEGTIDPVFDFPIIHQKTKDKRWLRHHSVIIKDEKGKPVGLRATVYDITCQKKMEKTLAENEKRYRDIFNATTDCLIVFNPKGQIVHANKQACETYGYKYDEIIKLSGKDIVHPDYVNKFNECLHNLTIGKSFHAESVDIRKDGTSFDVEIYGSVFEYNGSRHFLGSIRDITQQKKNREDLEERNKELRCLYQIGKELLKEQGVEKTLQKIIKQIIPAMHYPDITAVKINYLDKQYTSSNYREKLNHFLKSSITINGDNKGNIYVYYTKRKSFIIPEEQDFLNSIAERISSFIEKQQIKEKIEKSEKRLKNLIENVPIGIFIEDEKGRIIDCNKYVEELVGYNKKEILGKTPFELKIIPKNQITNVMKLSNETWQGKNHSQINLIISKKDGTQINVKISDYLTESDGKKTCLNIIQDISEQKKTKEVLIGKIRDLEKYKQITLGREMRVIELKNELNEICRRHGEPIKYSDIDKKRQEISISKEAGR